MTGQKIACIGAGQMATALAQGLVAAGFCQPEQLSAADPLAAARQRFESTVPGARLFETNAHAVQDADIVLLAVKPHQLQGVGREIASVLTERPLLVSIAAGVSLAELVAWFGTERVVRVMPNTPCLVGQGVSAFSLASEADEQDAKMVEQMMGSVGRAFQVEEPYLDCVTGLSGSGPAYVYLLIEALADGGVRVGLPRPLAIELAARTVRGAAEMVLAQGEHPALLKDRVTSPGGTTIAGLQVLEERGVRAAAIAAVEAATHRAREMGTRETGKDK